MHGRIKSSQKRAHFVDSLVPVPQALTTVAYNITWEGGKNKRGKHDQTRNEDNHTASLAPVFHVRRPQHLKIQLVGVAIFASSSSQCPLDWLPFCLWLIRRENICFDDSSMYPSKMAHHRKGRLGATTIRETHSDQQRLFFFPLAC